MNVWERWAEIKGILYGHCKSIISKVPNPRIEESRKFRDTGEIRIEEIRFTDDSILNFLEYLNLGITERYSYEYTQPSGFFFLYENEGYNNGIRKPLHHLHVGIMKYNIDKDLLRLAPQELIEHDGPHFKAPEMKFNEFMGIIVTNFFDDEYCDEMLRNLGL